MWVGGQHHAPAAFTAGKDPVPILQEAGWASEPVWIGAENLAPTGIRFPDLPARSESLYRLRHPSSCDQFIYIFAIYGRFVVYIHAVVSPLAAVSSALVLGSNS